MPVVYRRTFDDLGDTIARYSRRWAKLWGVPTWHIELRWSTEDADSYGEAYPDQAHYEIATLRFNTRKIRRESLSDKQIENIVAHEIGHISHYELIEKAHRVDDLLSEEMQSVEDRTIERHLKAIQGAYA